ncbi:MAG: hypothetical protein KDJ29_13175 [Hyphomicrobiales bacterium]|nr:hypothetical protein [Hyphomicrobiales bacterium]
MTENKTTVTEAELLAEFEALARRAGIEVFDDRREAMLACYRDYREMIALLHAPRDAGIETANVFSINSVKRGETRDR